MGLEPIAIKQLRQDSDNFGEFKERLPTFLPIDALWNTKFLVLYYANHAAQSEDNTSYTYKTRRILTGRSIFACFRSRRNAVYNRKVWSRHTEMAPNILAVTFVLVPKFYILYGLRTEGIFLPARNFRPRSVRFQC